MARIGTQFAKITGDYSNANVYGTWQLRSTDTTNKQFNIRLRAYLTISGSATFSSTTSTFKLDNITVKSGSYSYTKGDHLLGYKDITVDALADGSFPDTEISVYAKSFHFPATTKTAILTSNDIPKMELGSTITSIITNFEYPAVGMIEGVLINAELLEEYTTKLKATLNGVTYNLLDNVTTPEISVYFDEGTYNDNQEDDGDDSVLFPLSNLQIAQLIPNDRQINITFTLETYDADELKGTSSKNYTFQITNGSFQAQPTLDNDIETTNLTGDTTTFISNFSSIIVDSGIFESNNGATIKEYIFVRTNEDSIATIKSENSTHIFENPKLNDTFTVSVIDSRDFEVLLGTMTIDNENYFLLDYTIPQFTSLSIERPEQTAPYVGISLNGSFWNGNFGARENTLTLEYRYKLSNQSDFNEWASIQPTINENSFSYNGTIENISADLSALFEIRVLDTTGSTDLRTNISIPKGKSMFDWAEDYFSFNGELCINDDEVPCFQEDSVEDDGSRNVTLYDSQGNKLNVAPSVEGGSVKVILPTDLSNLSTSYNYFHPFAYNDNDVSTLGTKLTYGSITTNYGDRTDATVYGVTVGSDVEQLKVTTNIRFLNNTNSQTALSTLVGVVRNGELTSYGGTSDSVSGSSRFTSSFTLTQIPVEEGDFVFVYGYKGVKTHDLDVISSNEMTNVTFEVSHINGVTVINNTGGGTGSGTSNYEELDNLPRINGVKVTGNKSLNEYGIQPVGDYALKNEIPNIENLETKTDATSKLSEAKTYTDTKVANLIGTAPTTLDTLQEIAVAIQENEEVVDALNSAIGNKANKSEIPTKTSDLTNDSGFITSSSLPTKTSQLTNDSGYITSIPSEYITETELTSKGYLTSVPSEYVTDSELAGKGYLTSFTETDPTVPNHVKNITSDDITNWNNKSDFSGSYNDLTNKPTLFSGNYNDLTNKPTIPTVPTNISAFTNDSGYITANDIPDGIEELTSPVRIWNLEEGTYQLPASCKIYYYGSSNTSNSFTVNSTSTLFVSKQSSYKYYFIIGGSSLVNYLYYGYTISSSGTNYSLKLNDIKIPTSTLAQYNLGYYATTSTITNLNSTNYVNPGMYGMSINAGTGIPSEITSDSTAILMVLSNRQAPSGVTYIRQDLYVPGKSKHWKRNVLFNASSYTYPDWEEVVEDLSDYALKTEIPDISGKQDTLVSGTNIKTINGESLIGSGDITIEAGGSGITEINADFDITTLDTGIYNVAEGVVMTTYGGSGGTETITWDYGCLLTVSQFTNSDTGLGEGEQWNWEAFAVHTGGTDVFQYYGFVVKITSYNISTGLYTKINTNNIVTSDNLKTINGNSLIGSGNITIEGGSSGGSAITELTSPIRLWDLEEGFYKIPSGSTVYYYGTTNTTSKISLAGGAILTIANYNDTTKRFTIFCGSNTEKQFVLGYTTSTGGSYQSFDMSNIKPPTFSSASHSLGYTYNTYQNTSNLNGKNELSPGVYARKVNASTTGIPTGITEEAHIVIETKNAFPSANATYPNIRQDLYALSLNKHWYRMINYASSSNVTYGEWIEIKENTDKVAIELTGVNSSSSYDCFYFPATNMVWFSMYATGLTISANSRVTVATVPEGYKPNRRTALATDELQDPTGNIKASVTSGGEITLLTSVAKSSGDDQYISGWWYVG